ncbi:hypothetical protein CANINC_002867 [Pichia inconspicua]|uniref:HIT domain-containing protein n=1 Tax=Pichia inconspicua TaxID=52247 RepID=A0A4T0X070_9ASCO|nr:hypothetical protein CANINC_002867 [[Candida] inconspicua]
MASKLKNFTFVKVLDEDSQQKRIVLHGRIDNADAILTLEKTFFTNPACLNDYYTNIYLDSSNDVYYWGKTKYTGSDPTCKFNLIYPATETHFRKYQNANLHMIRETPEAYESIVKPYIETMRGDRIKWVRNILFDGAEAERVLFKNDDYILLPDMKWDGKDLESLYCCCIVYDEKINSIRDLNCSHIAYLERIRESIFRELPKIYNGLNSDDLRIYVHYQPSYYHFHIHVVNVNFIGLANSMLCGKAILLEDIIDNLHFLGEKGYLSKTIAYQLKETHALYSLGLDKYRQ